MNAMFQKPNSKPPELKSVREFGMMREAGKLVARALKICRDMAVPGARTADIDRVVEAFYMEHNATPLFKGYPGKVPFPTVTCMSVNEMVVHGIPSDRPLKDGDLLSVDTACRLNNWCADRAVTIPVGTVRPERLRLLRVAEETLQIAIDELPRRRWWSEIASRMQKHVEQAGFYVVTNFVGHGIGRVMHENPQVPNYVTKETRKTDFRLEPGLVLAIEPMVNMGTAEVVTLRDHWTVVTRNGLPSVHVEHTLAITPDGKIEIITSDEGAFDDDPVPTAIVGPAG